MIRKIIFLLSAAVLVLSGCSKFLDRQPLSQISPDKGFSTEAELQLYVRSFYDKMLPLSDNNNNGFTSLYNEDVDNVVKNNLTEELMGTRTVPTSGGGWSWTNLRNINYFLQNYQLGKLDSSVTYKYVAVARFFRAYFYFNMVAHFGDVPLYTTVMEANDSTALQQPRDSRTVVMNAVIEDLDFAIDHLGTDKNVAEVTKWTALALKSRACLFEGTFRIYHTEFKLPDANRFLQLSADAAETIMTQGPYTIYKTSPDVSYRDLFASLTVIPDEIILARQYSAGLQIYHNVNYYTITPSYGKPGLEKKLVNSYLMKDGSRFTDLPGFDTIRFYREMQNRDPRLSQTIRTPGYKRIGGTVALVPQFNATVTGYHVTKFVTSTVDDAFTRSYNPLPVFRYAEVLLNYAEAKAELGTLEQGDIDKSIKLLRDRVAMPNLDKAAAIANPDPYLAAQYKGVAGRNNAGLILEVRRERRIELVMEGLRWNDIMRWKEGHLLAEPFKGAYFPGVGNYDLDGDGKIDLGIYTGTPPTQSGVQYLKLGTDIVLENGENGGHIAVNKTIAKKFDETKDYLYPIPTQELLLNHNLVQNPNWK